MTSNEICLPTNSLAKDGMAPEQGSPIEIQTIKGTVTRVEGGNTYFRPTEVNGQPIESAAPGEDQAGELTAESLRARAAEEDGDLGI